MKLLASMLLFALLGSHFQGVSQTVLSQHMNTNPSQVGARASNSGTLIVYREYDLVREGVTKNSVQIMGAQFYLKAASEEITPQQLKVNFYALQEAFPANFLNTSTLLGTSEMTVNTEHNEGTLVHATLNFPVLVPKESRILISVEMQAAATINLIAFEDAETKPSWYASECGEYEIQKDTMKGLILNLVLVGNSAQIMDSNFQLKVTPNPTLDIITLAVDNPMVDIQKVDVFNALGAKLNVETNNQRLDLSHLNNGVYFLHVYTSWGKVVKKVIKE